MSLSETFLLLFTLSSILSHNFQRHIVYYFSILLSLFVFILFFNQIYQFSFFFSVSKIVNDITVLKEVFLKTEQLKNLLYQLINHKIPSYCPAFEEGFFNSKENLSLKFRMIINCCYY